MKTGRQPNLVETPIDHTFHQIESEKLRRFEATLTPEYWAYREAWENNPREHIAGIFPLHLDIEATTNCNLRCTMCPRTEMVSDGTFWQIQNFDFALYRKIIDEGSANGLRAIKFNFLGEPTLNRQLPSMIAYAKEANIIDVMLNTNAVMLDADLSRKLIESGLDKLFFSFDGSNPASFERIRIGATFAKVINNIIGFHRVRREMNSIRPFTRVSMVRMAENASEFEEFRELFSPIVDAVAYVDFLDHAGQKPSNRGLTSHRPMEKTFCCPQLWQRMFIHPDGLVTACCIDSKRQLKMGNIHDETVSEIWNGERYRHLRDTHTRGQFAQIPICANCAYARSWGI